MSYTIKNISAIVNGEIYGKEDALVSDLLIDSRNLGNPSVSLFFAIKGERHDGHLYISDLYQNGVLNFVVSTLPSNYRELTDVTFIVVKDTLKALQALSAFHRKQFTLPVIAITGSNGKTIMKEWLYQLLRSDENIVRSPKSYNSQVGVPLSVWQIKKEHTLGIFEAGISMPNEMALLATMIKPTLGLITNIGLAHNENFETQEQKTHEKLKLFVDAETLIYCKDYLLISKELSNNSVFENTKVFTWSRKSSANLLISKIDKHETETKIQGIFNNSFIDIVIPFADEASIENAIHCWATLLYLGCDNHTIAQRMLHLTPIAMRLELKEGVNNCSIINDSYNSDISSLSIALDFLNQQKQHPKKTLVLSDILQSGENDETLYKAVAELVHKKGVTRLIGIGNGISSQAHQFAVESVFYSSTEAFLKQYDNAFFRDETILLKGARAFGFENINRVIQQKSHQTVLEINLNAIVHNLNYYRAQLKPDTKIMAMVKAFSYGSGSFEIANILQFHRIDYLAVAYSDEGVELRKAGITLPIMVMNPEEDSYDAMIYYQLEPEIFSLRTLHQFEKTLKRLAPVLTKPVLIHLKIDTGMHRLGFGKEDVNELIVRIKNNKHLQVKSIFSHLASSDNLEHDAFTRHQIDTLTVISETIKKHFDYPILQHILNSSGVTNYPEAQFDMVRLGVGLYGVGTNENEQQQLQNVSTLKTCISQIKTIPAHETIGYNRKGTIRQDTTIAIVPIGYADGLSRKLSNGNGKMLVKGKEATIVGNVCMDMCMIDITGIDATENDEVTVFGDNYSITEIANQVGTIPYEILTNVSRRVKRVYYQE
jgi:Alr-MurF fusion protein